MSLPTTYPPRRARTGGHRWTDMTPTERFWSHVEKSDGCWLWTGSTTTAGYGKAHFYGRAIYAHRLVWELERGPIRPGMEVCHHCDTPSCVKPGHLFLGTHAQNMADMSAKGRAPRGERSGTTRLTAEKASAIREARATGRLLREIAAQYDISVTTVWHIVHNRTWLGAAVPSGSDGAA